MEGIITTIISGITAVIVAYIGIMQKQIQARNERQDALRREMTLIELEMIQSLARLSLTTARAIRGELQNGAIEEAERWVLDVKEKMDCHMRKFVH